MSLEPSPCTPTTPSTIGGRVIGNGTAILRRWKNIAKAAKKMKNGQHSTCSGGSRLYLRHKRSQLYMITSLSVHNHNDILPYTTDRDQFLQSRDVWTLC